MEAANETRPVRPEVPTEPNVVEVHTPRLYVPEECLDRCTKLQSTTGRALLKSLLEPHTQNDVICHERQKLRCIAQVVETGSWGSFGQRVEGSDEHFVGDVKWFRGGKYPTVSAEVAVVIRSGITAHHPSEIQKRS